MTDPDPSPATLEERVASLAAVVNKLIGVVSKLDDETSDTAAAAFNSDVPRVAGHKATAQELKALSDTLDSWLTEWAQQTPAERAVARRAIGSVSRIVRCNSATVLPDPGRTRHLDE